MSDGEKAADANWEMVRHVLESISQQQADFLRAQVHRDAAAAERARVQDLLLIARFDTIDARLDRYNTVLERGLALLDALNTIVSGVRSASDSTYDIATSAVRSIDRLRAFLKVPDAIFEHENVTAGTDATSDGPTRSLR